MEIRHYKNPDVKPRLAKALTDKMRLDMQAEGAAESEIEKRVANSMRRIDEAPVIILLCRDITDVRVNTPEETIMNIQSTALAGLQFCWRPMPKGSAEIGFAGRCMQRIETQEVLRFAGNDGSRRR